MVVQSYSSKKAGFVYIDDSLEVVGFLAGTFDFLGFLFVFPPLESFAAFEFDLTER